MNISILLPGTLPVPAINGGAIETLLTGLINENENMKNNLHFTVYANNSITNDRKYQKTDFIYIDSSSFKAKIVDFVFRIIRKLLRKKYFFSYYLIECARHIKRTKPKFIYIDGRIDYVLPLSQTITCPIILHIHTDILNLVTPLGSKIIDKVHCIIAVSNYISQRITEINQNDKHKISVLKNAIDLNLFSFDKCNSDLFEIDRKKGYEHIVLFCGRLDANKGIIELIKAFKLIGRRDAKLVIVGSSWFKQSRISTFAQQLINTYAADNIEFLGYVSNEDMPQLYYYSDVTVLPSLTNEAAGLVILESLSMGTPIITTKKGGMPEYNSFDNMQIEISNNLVLDLSRKIDEFINNSQNRDRTLFRNSVSTYNYIEYYKNFLSILSKEFSEIRRLI